jgi:hypothetical protein
VSNAQTPMLFYIIFYTKNMEMGTPSAPEGEGARDAE